MDKRSRHHSVAGGDSCFEYTVPIHFDKRVRLQGVPPTSPLSTLSTMLSASSCFKCVGHLPDGRLGNGREKRQAQFNHSYHDLQRLLACFESLRQQALTPAPPSETIKSSSVLCSTAESSSVGTTTAPPDFQALLGLVLVSLLSSRIPQTGRSPLAKRPSPVGRKTETTLQKPVRASMTSSSVKHPKNKNDGLYQSVSRSPTTTTTTVQQLDSLCQNGLGRFEDMCRPQPSAPKAASYGSTSSTPTTSSCCHGRTSYPSCCSDTQKTGVFDCLPQSYATTPAPSLLPEAQRPPLSTEVHYLSNGASYVDGTALSNQTDNTRMGSNDVQRLENKSHCSTLAYLSAEVPLPTATTTEITEASRQSAAFPTGTFTTGHDGLGKMASRTQADKDASRLQCGPRSEERVPVWQWSQACQEQRRFPMSSVLCPFSLSVANHTWLPWKVHVSQAASVAVSGFRNTTPCCSDTAGPMANDDLRRSSASQSKNKLSTVHLQSQEERSVDCAQQLYAPACFPRDFSSHASFLNSKPFRCSELCELYERYFVGDVWVQHLMRRDFVLAQKATDAHGAHSTTPRTSSWDPLMSHAHRLTKERLQQIFEPVVNLSFPFNAISPSFPNYLLLDALSLVRQFIYTLSLGVTTHINGLLCNGILQMDLGHLMANQAARYFLLLLIASCILLACDLNESSDVRVNSAVLQRFYVCAKRHLHHQHHHPRERPLAPCARETHGYMVTDLERSFLNRELRHARLIVCETLQWDINVGGLRQWLEVIVTRMALRDLQASQCRVEPSVAGLFPFAELQRQSVHDNMNRWTTLYFEAEHLACQEGFCLKYIFDWSATQLQAAVQCLVAVILKRQNFRPFLALLEDVTTELALLQRDLTLP